MAARVTLRADLSRALGPLTANLITDIGVRCHVRRRDPAPVFTASGGETAQWYRPQGLSLGVMVFLYAADEQARIREWGRENVPAMVAIAGRNPLRDGDRIKPMDGEYTDQVLEVVGRRPDDISDTALLAINVVPNPDDGPGGFT